MVLYFIIPFIKITLKNKQLETFFNYLYKIQISSKTSIKVWMLFKTKYLINTTDTCTLTVTKFMYSCMFKLIKKLINTWIASTRQLLHHLKTHWKFLLNLKSINDAIFFKEIWNGTGGLLCIFINKTNFLQDLSIQHGKTSCEDQIIICCIHIFLLSRGFL